MVLVVVLQVHASAVINIRRNKTIQATAVLLATQKEFVSKSTRTSFSLSRSEEILYAEHANAQLLKIADLISKRQPLVRNGVNFPGWSL